MSLIDAKIEGNLDINGALQTHGNVGIAGDCTVDDDLSVGGTSTFGNNVDVTGNVAVTGNVSITGSLTVPGGEALKSSNVAASAAVTNTVAETAFDKTYQFAANALAAGDVVRIRAQVIASATHSTDTLTLKLKIGTTVVIATAAVDVADGDIGFIDAMLVIRTAGAGGTFVASGAQALGVPGTVTNKPFLLASTAIDTTAAKTISLTATWSVADAGNSCRLDMLTVEHLKAAA